MARNPVEIKVESHIPQVVGIVQSQLNRKVFAMGKAVQTAMSTQVLVGERYGRWYKVPGTQRRYRASIPGEPPASRTGDLRRSYRVGKVEGTALDTHVKVGSALPYAPILEEQLDRQHLSVALVFAQPDIEAILRGDWGI